MKKFKGTAILLFAFMLIIACKPKGDKAEVSKAAEVKTATTGSSYNTDVTASKVKWEGSKPGSKHTGTINLSNGTLTVKDNKIASGSFDLDMNSIAVTDLKAGEGKEDLEAHLKGSGRDNADDFFNVALYPKASFEITKVTDLMNVADANTMIYGNLTLRDKTQEVGFKANVKISDKVVSVSAPTFTIDRTQWGINYASKSVFDNLKDKFVNDEIGLQINLLAKAPAM